MATGHTYPVIDGEITTLKDFAYECSKSFVWSMHEGHTLAYPPRHDASYAEQLAKALAELTFWDRSNEECKYDLWSKYAREQDQHAAKDKDRADMTRARIEPLLYEARATPVPETHANFRKFMIDQLTETLRLDGTPSDFFKVIPYPEWADARRGELLRTIKRCSETMNEAEENNQKSRQWISTLATLFNLEVREP